MSPRLTFAHVIGFRTPAPSRVRRAPSGGRDCARRFFPTRPNPARRDRRCARRASIAAMSSAAGFSDTEPAGVAECAEQDRAGLLRQRLAAGHADRGAADVADARENFGDRHGAAGEGMLGVAPVAAQGTAGQADEGGGRPARVDFALDRMKDFADAQRRRCRRPPRLLFLQTLFGGFARRTTPDTGRPAFSGPAWPLGVARSSASALPSASKASGGLGVGRPGNRHFGSASAALAYLFIWKWLGARPVPGVGQQAVQLGLMNARKRRVGVAVLWPP